MHFRQQKNKFEYYIANNTTGKSASGYVELDASKQFDGTTVEWVVERCKSGGSLTSLGDYGTMTMEPAFERFDKGTIRTNTI